MKCYTIVIVTDIYVVVCILADGTNGLHSNHEGFRKIYNLKTIGPYLSSID
jgi:hypothetical protein